MFVLPVGRASLAVLIELQQDLGGVQGGAGIGVQQQLLVLGQVLGRSLLGQSSTVEQLSLEQWQVGLERWTRLENEVEGEQEREESKDWGR